MSVRILAVAALLSIAALPAIAQETPAAPVAVQAGPSTESEAAFEAKAEAFEARMAEMKREMQAAVAAAGGDQTRLGADLDAITARYQPDADAFAVEVSDFLTASLAAVPEDQRARMSAMGPALDAQVRGAPARAKEEALAAAATPTPAAPQ